MQGGFVHKVYIVALYARTKIESAKRHFCHSAVKINSFP